MDPPTGGPPSEPVVGSDDGTGSGSDSDETTKPEEVKEVLIVHEEKESFASKLSYILVLVGYAVGFGNIWRFPYLMQENGGVVFLIPFIICMIFLGVPVFFLELAIGQRLRKSALHAWNEISPFLSGVGVAAGGACIILGYYYTTLIAWCIYYFFSSFQTPLPWVNCEVAEVACCNPEFRDPNGRDHCLECKTTGASSHFWYEIVIETSGSIKEPGRFNWGIAGALFLAWFITWGILVRGIKASGQVAYVTALLPYVVLTIFLIRGLTLPGMAIGYEVVYTPDWTLLADAKIWFTAGSQVFFNFGLGFGILVSFSALLPANNNCYRDAIAVACINFLTSILASSVVFPTLGLKGTKEYNECTQRHLWDSNGTFKRGIYLNGTFSNGTLFNGVFNENNNASFIEKLFPNGTRNESLVRDDPSSPFLYLPNMYLNYTDEKERTLAVFHNGTRFDEKDKGACDLVSMVKATAGGTGLIFIAYAEAIASFEYPQFWAILFFVMILTLGIDSGFTTVEGAVIMLYNWNLFGLNLKKWKITTGVCVFLWLMSFLFAFGWAEYMLTFIDEFTINWTLLIVGFFECIGVAWIYGLKRFSYDIKLMTGRKADIFMMLCWRFISPLLMFGLFVATLIDYFSKDDSLMYEVYNHTTGKKHKVKWPGYAVGIGFFILILAVGSVPLFAILAKFGIHIIKQQPPGEFPEDELRAERNITDADFDRPETTFERILYWGSPADLHRNSTAVNDQGGGGFYGQQLDEESNPASASVEPSEPGSSGSMEKV